ncbi:hypothetical protein GALL_284780 [mine drainage metagenome]|jgi:hypothetical protein|uniref:Uncharacterized protein n=1 Tax=mine drainage metagenome TaxID=410659 RepID=A0A1J5RC82_9ZZZZ
MSIRMTITRGVAAAFVGLGALAAVPAAQAETRWEAAHPRRDQVLDRTGHLHQRIARERREGEISPARAHALQLRVRRVRAREQALARRNGGYITPAQQAALNRQENRLSQRVGP